jgi:hypothetical protein
MLAHRSEIEQTLAQLRQAQHELDVRGIAYGPVKLGAMIEIPAAALTVRSFLQYFDFLSIGTNDLIQYTLAIDRADETVAHLYDPMHPAVLRLVAEVIAAANAAGKEVCVCGEMAGDLSMTRLLLGLGLRSFPCTPRRFWPSSRRCCVRTPASWHPGPARCWQRMPGADAGALKNREATSRQAEKGWMNYANSQEIARALEPVLEDAALAQQLAAQARPAVWLQTTAVEDEAEIASGSTKLAAVPTCLPVWPGPSEDAIRTMSSG